jgi:hypothetical protein
MTAAAGTKNKHPAVAQVTVGEAIAQALVANLHSSYQVGIKGRDLRSGAQPANNPRFRKLERNTFHPGRRNGN